MPKIKCLPKGVELDVPHGKLLIDALVEAGFPVANSCSSDFVCGKCNIQIVAGAENLSRKSDNEIKLLKREKCGESDRISCVTRVNGDITVTASYW